MTCPRPVYYLHHQQILLLLLLLVVARASVILTTSAPQLCASVPGQPACVSVCDGSSYPIDLTSLEPNVTTGPVFKNVQDPTGDATYLYNPCYPFNYKDCKNAHVCFEGKEDFTENLGDGGSEEMVMGSDGVPYLHYISPVNDPSSSIKVLVYLHCTTSNAPTITYLGDRMPQNYYYFNLSCCQVCPGGCRAQKSYWDIPVGYIGLLTVVVVLFSLVSYCIIGSVLLRVKKDNNIVPNQKFWTALPSLIKDGCLFSFKPLITTISRKVHQKSYETIQGRNSHKYTT